MLQKSEKIRGKASILAVGTELTTGQISNGNAVWISEQLVSLGIEIVLHETVPDDRQGIRIALDHCASVSQFIFVTGGLGPTTDDFTREIIAEWISEPLEFQPDTWKNIQKRLSDLGIPIAESNRQQCFFPKNCQILPNPQGTASGFTWTRSEFNQQIYVFPGPPHEVLAVWQQSVPKMIQKQLPEIKPLRLFTWQCMGKSEAELGEITETVMKGSELKIGYRAHRPIVEIKVWCPENDLEQKHPWIEKLTQCLSPWVMTQQNEDLGKKLLLQLPQNQAIHIIDAATSGILAARMGNLLKHSSFKEIASRITFITKWTFLAPLENPIDHLLQETDNKCLYLLLSGLNPEGKGIIGLKTGDEFFHETIHAFPNREPEQLDRTRYFTAERALKRWNEWLLVNASARR